MIGGVGSHKTNVVVTATSRGRQLSARKSRGQREHFGTALPGKLSFQPIHQRDFMRNKTKADQKREDRRNELWPGSAGWIWDVFDEESTVGFATISRLMPWITVLIRHLSGKGKDPSSIYWELWCRDMGQGFIQISDEQECAYASGYSSSRALRTWREHIQLLADLNFIKTERSGNREVGFVLLMNPLAVARWYHQQKQTPEGWWTAFLQRASEIGAPMPPALSSGSTEAAKPVPESSEITSV